MSWLARPPLVGAYVCPGGVFIIECRRVSGGLEVARTLEVPASIDDAGEAADQLCNALRAAHVRRADVAVAVRGFGLAHHVLQLPPATDELLTPIVERELRRLEPQLEDSVVGWIPLPTLTSTGPDAASQRSLLAAASPADLVVTFEQRLRAAGHRLAHLTPLATSMQRLVEEFESDSRAAALVTPLPDGAFIGFVLDGGIRLAIEPPLPQDAAHEVAAMAEEVQLGVTFVRQQFRGAQIDQIAVIGFKPSLEGAETVLGDRLGVPAKRLGADLAPAAYAALGALLDARSPSPLALGGTSLTRSRSRSRSTLDRAVVAGIALVAALFLWVAFESYSSRRAASSLRESNARIARDSFALAPVRATALQRRRARDAAAALQLVSIDRGELQNALAGIAYAVRAPVRLDTLQLFRAETGWRATVSGTVVGTSNARAVQSLHDLYREIPQRLAVDSVHLDHLTYGETAGEDEGSVVKFQLSFGIAARRN
jgi:hypothetical protein